MLYCGVDADIVTEKFCGLDLTGRTRERIGEPWKEDLVSKNDGLGEEVRVVAMVAIEISGWNSLQEGFRRRVKNLG